MSMTISEKILAKASGKESVSAGEIVWAEPRTILAHDISGVGASLYIKEHFGEGSIVIVHVEPISECISTLQKEI